MAVPKKRLSKTKKKFVKLFGKKKLINKLLKLYLLQNQYLKLY